MKIPYQTVLTLIPLMENITSQYPQVKDYRHLAREYVVYHQNHTNDSDMPDKAKPGEEITYRDVYTSTTTNAFHLGSSIRAEGKVDLLFGSERVSVGVNFDWDTSNTNSETHESKRKFTISEEFTLPPRSITEITLLIKEGNYDVDFSADILIDDAALFERASRYDSPYLKRLADAKYEAEGELKGVYGYKIDSRKKSIPLNNTTPTKTATKTITETFTQTATPTNQVNHLAVNKYSSAGLALLTGLFLV
ncbi:4348_t:CDS:2 [Entrophospora sp. SA101]|nr:4348_t:CDS:2 [Entrophospora sp. SA101]